MSLEIINNIIDIKDDAKEKKKQYRKIWVAANRDRVNEKQRLNYLVKVNEKPEYREIFKERTKQRQAKIKELKDPSTIKPRGRPIKEKVIKDKKPMGRPRLTLII